MIPKVRITYLESDYIMTCYLTNEQLEYYDLNDNIEYVAVSIGSLDIYLNVIIVENGSVPFNTLCLSEDVKDHMHVPEGTVLQIRKTGECRLCLGPFIGIFINQEKIDYLSSGNGVTAYTHFDSACKSLYGLCCLFSIENIDWDNMLINGVIKKNSKWIMTTLPLPLVIYDRNVENNCRVESRELRKKLGPKFHVLNTMPKLAKLETIRALKKSPELLSLIPKTIPYRSSENLKYALNNHSIIYLKPDSLSKGKGIFRISKISDYEYEAEYRTKEENHKVSLNSLDALDHLMEEYRGKGGSYLIQQEIQKACYKGNPFDFRLLYQKDWQGIWQPSGIAGRIGAPGSIITSPRSGGTVAELSTILKEVFNEDYSTKGGLYENIVYFGRKIALALEREFGDCVELGLDMAIDVNRKIWVIEVNGKPLKVSLKRLNNSEMVKRCNKRPIEYLARVTGFKSADTEAGGLSNNNEYEK